MWKLIIFIKTIYEAVALTYIVAPCDLSIHTCNIYFVNNTTFYWECTKTLKWEVYSAKFFWSSFGVYKVILFCVSFKFYVRPLPDPVGAMWEK